MKDLINRLRELTFLGNYPNAVHDAADALERLRNENVSLEVTVDNLTAVVDSFKYLDSQRLESLRAIEPWESV